MAETASSSSTLDSGKDRLLFLLLGQRPHRRWRYAQARSSSTSSRPWPGTLRWVMRRFTVFVLLAFAKVDGMARCCWHGLLVTLMEAGMLMGAIGFVDDGLAFFGWWWPDLEDGDDLRRWTRRTWTGHTWISWAISLEMSAWCRRSGESNGGPGLRLIGDDDTVRALASDLLDLGERIGAGDPRALQEFVGVHCGRQWVAAADRVGAPPDGEELDGTEAVLWFSADRTNTHKIP